jgi:DNA polymerase-4
VYLTPDFPYYREASKEVMSIVRAHVDTVEVVGLDEAYLELTGLPAPRAAMRRILNEIEVATGLGGSVGIGPNKLVAKVASDAEKPRGFVVLTREEACARFAGSSCSLVPGIGPKTNERLRSLGIDTLGKLAAVVPEELSRRFGSRFAAELQRRALFEDDTPVTEERKVISESREVTFDYDISDFRELESILEGLVERLCAGLAEQRRAGRTVGIKVRLDDFTTHTRARTLSEAVASVERVGPVALGLLRRFAPARPVRLLGVRVAGLESSPAGADRQLSLSV